MKKIVFYISLAFLLFVGFRLLFSDTIFSFPSVFAKDYFCDTEYNMPQKDTSNSNYYQFPICIPNPIRVAKAKQYLDELSNPSFLNNCKIVSIVKPCKNKIRYLIQSKINPTHMCCVTFDVISFFPYRIRNPKCEMAQKVYNPYIYIDNINLEI